MRRRAAFVIVVSVCFALLPVAAHAQPAPVFSPGLPGLGDPYFPLDGNGGYDIKHTRLELTYDPATDVLSAVATIQARATQNLSAFNFDFVGLEVRSITVDGRPATWSRDGGELTVTPARGIVDRNRFITVVTYDGIPETLPDDSGFMHTDDGALVIGEPDVAATWFPANDHPLDKSPFTFVITAPTGLEVLANGVLLEQDDGAPGWTTWEWEAADPMAPYLAMMAIGEFAVNAYEANNLPFWDAIDPDLNTPFAPRTGARFAVAQTADLAYKRLARTINVPAGGAQLSFWIRPDTETDWDFVFVEAQTPGSDDWTTLPDINGHTTQSTGNSCPFWLGLHPFLEHYQTDNGDGTCSPSGSTGEWWAATGQNLGYENWVVDLSAYSGSAVEVSISYASDDVVQARGVFVDDIAVSTGEGSTSFEDDGDSLDGWTTPGAPEGSEPNPNDWVVGTAADGPAPVGEVAAGSLARQPAVITFLAEIFGPYPFSTAGGIVDDDPRLGFALENQTRPIYSTLFFDIPINGDSVVVHELAHQWVGDDLAVEAWQHIWLNEGFATYAEWLWAEEDMLATADEIFEFYYGIPADDPFWTVTIGDPGPDALFDIAMYYRGAMTLHALRRQIGDGDFFRALRGWTRSQAGGNVSTDEFIALAEEVSGEQLDNFFDAWLFTPEKPPAPPNPNPVAVAVAEASIPATGMLERDHGPRN